MSEETPEYKVLETAIIDYMKALDPEAIVTEWFLPVVTVDPDFKPSEARHTYVSGCTSLHSRVGILAYHLRNSEADMVHAGRGGGDDD